MVYLVELQALAPLGERDAVVAVLVARVQEGRDAVLQRHQRRADREQLVPGHEPAEPHQIFVYAKKNVKYLYRQN